MKTFKDFIQNGQVDKSDEAGEVQLNENIRLYQLNVRNNEGREGKPFIDASGQEKRGSVYLGDGDIGNSNGNAVTIEKFNQVTGRYQTINLTKDQLKYLQRL